MEEHPCKDDAHKSILIKKKRYKDTYQKKNKILSTKRKGAPDNITPQTTFA